MACYSDQLLLHLYIIPSQKLKVLKKLCSITIIFSR